MIESGKGPRPSRSERLPGVIIAVMTCLDGVGIFALLYFPLKYLK